MSPGFSRFNRHPVGPAFRDQSFKSYFRHAFTSLDVLTHCCAGGAGRQIASGSIFFHKLVLF